MAVYMSFEQKTPSPWLLFCDHSQRLNLPCVWSPCMCVFLHFFHSDGKVADNRSIGRSFVRTWKSIAFFHFRRFKVKFRNLTLLSIARFCALTDYCRPSSRLLMFWKHFQSNTTHIWLASVSFDSDDDRWPSVIWTDRTMMCVCFRWRVEPVLYQFRVHWLSNSDQEFAQVLKKATTRQSRLPKSTQKIGLLQEQADVTDFERGLSNFLTSDVGAMINQIGPWTKSEDFSIQQVKLRII